MMALDDFALYVILPILALAVVVVFPRMVRGPSLPDLARQLNRLHKSGSMVAHDLRRKLKHLPLRPRHELT